MAKLIAILIVALICEAVGVVFLSKGLKQLPALGPVNIPNVLGMVKSGLTNPNIVLGVFFEALFFSGLLILMSRGDVSFVWPLTALGFGLTTLAARFLLHEEVSPVRWLGVAFIILGAGLITYSEKVKVQENAAPPPPATAERVP
jgi:uncharacterized membrane protein